MKHGLRRVVGSGLCALAALLCAHSEAHAHGCSGPSAWEAISSGILQQSCFSGCHGGSGNGGMSLSINDEDSWYAALVNRAPVTSAALAVGKLRVDPKRPWNSFLVDKLTGDLKSGEGNPMPNLSSGYVFQCPGGVEKIKGWILAGADRCGAAPGDPSPDPNLLVCDMNQPTLAAPQVPSDGVQLAGMPFALTRTVAAGGPREGDQATTVSVGTAPTCDNTQGQCFITGIDIKASAGTEYVTVSRAGESAPIAVARGTDLTLSLPAEVGVAIAKDQQLDIHQWIRNDYWAGPAPYTNVTTGSVYVNVHLASSAAHEAQLLRDGTGDQALFVPPESYGATGGVWLPTPPASPAGAMVSIWSDRRALKTELLDAAGQKLSEDPQGYTAVAGPVVAYSCLYANGWVPNRVASLGSNGSNATLNTLTGPVDLSSPLKWGCEGTANIPPGVPGQPATSCARSTDSYGNDCSAAGTQRCQPANLVSGPGVDDGRCTLVGLWW